MPDPRPPCVRAETEVKLISLPVEVRSRVESDGALISLAPVSHRPVAALYRRTIVGLFSLACQANHPAQTSRPRRASSEKYGELRHE